VLVDLFGTAGALAGLGAVLTGTVLSAPAAPLPGGEGLNWWAMLAAGAGLLLVGVPVGLVLEGLGGLLAAIGAVLALVAVVLGFPEQAGDR
jgi:hypothetical protein